MVEIPDYGADAEPKTNDDKLAKLRRLATEMAKLKLQAIQLEEELRTVSKQLENYEENLVPTLMTDIGLTELKTATGMKIVLKSDLFGTLPKNEEKRSRAFEYLEETGNGGLIKQEISVVFPRDTEEERKRFEQLVEESGVAAVADVKNERTIHHQTMLAFLRRERKDGRNVPLEAFGTIEKTVATIETPKAK